MRSKKLLIVILVVLVLAAVGAGGWLSWSAANRADPEGRLILFGNADIREVELAFIGSDRIREILVEEGDRVDAGQVVGRLETARLEPLVQQAAARAEAQRQVVARLEAGSRPEEILRARAAADQARAIMEDAQDYRDDVEKAFARQAASARERETAQRRLDAAQAAYRAAQQTLALAVAGPRQEDIDEAKAMLRMDEADLALAQQRLRDAELKAPTPGIIRARLLEPGDMASPARPALTLALTDPLWIRVYVDEPDLGRLKPGMRADVTTDSFPGKTYRGWVGYIAPTAEFTPKTVESLRVRTGLVYEVRVFVHNHEGELRLGMPATVSVDLTTPPAQAPAETPGSEG